MIGAIPVACPLAWLNSWWPSPSRALFGRIGARRRLRAAPPRLDDQFAEHRLGTHPSASPGRERRVNPLFEAYADALRRRRLEPSSIAANLLALRNLDTWLDENNINAQNLDPLNCERYFEEQLDDYHVNTLRHRLSIIRSATADVKLPRLTDEEPRVYTNDELRTILAAVRTSREERLFFLYAFTGIRQAEAVHLRWDQIDYRNQQIKLIGKGGKFRLIPLHQTLTHILHKHDIPGRGDYIISARDGGSLSKSCWGQTARGLVDRAGIKTRAPAHTFRKTVATVMHERGARSHTIDAIMGWAPRTVRDRHYIRVAPKTLHQAIHTLYQDDPICPQPNQTPPTPPFPTTTSRSLPTDLQRELTRLAELEQELGLQPA